MILVIGRSGLIASRIASKLDAVFTSSKIPPDRPFLFLDLRNPEAFDYQQLNSETTVIFLAAVSSPDECEVDYTRAREINVTGTEHFISQALKRGSRVLFFSSDVVYGSHEELVNESSPVQPSGKYALMKVEIEQKFADNPNFVVFRLSYVLSESDKFLAYLRDCVQRQRIAEVFHPFVRRVVSVDDVVCAVEAAIQRWQSLPSRLINICGTRDVSRYDITSYVKQVVGERLRYRLLDPPSGFWDARPQNVIVESLHLQALLGRPPRNIEDVVSEITRRTV